jgi:hypothetical protein
MTQRDYMGLALISWVFFFFHIWPGQPKFWVIVGVLVGCLALGCTIILIANPPWKGKPEAGTWVEKWVALPAGMLFWAVLLFVLSESLPQYWSQLCPLFSVGLLYGVSRIWPARKPEDKHDVAVPQDVDS